MVQTAYGMTLSEALEIARHASECEESDVLAALTLLGRRVAALLAHCDQTGRAEHRPIVATFLAGEFAPAAIRGFLEHDGNQCECDGPGPVTDMHRPDCPMAG